MSEDCISIYDVRRHRNIFERNLVENVELNKHTKLGVKTCVDEKWPV